MYERQFMAASDQLADVMAFAETSFREAGCASGTMQSMLLATEEIFMNVVHYAYPETGGAVIVRCDRLDCPERYAMWFCDFGTPFDPTARAAPDLSENLMEREIGGLGIFLVQRMMDQVVYSREEGQNILYIEKNA